MPDEFVDHVDVVFEVLPVADDRRILSDLIQPLGCYALHRPSHQRIVFEDRVEVLNGQREETAVGLCSDARHTLCIRQQTDLFNDTTAALFTIVS